MNRSIKTLGGTIDVTNRKDNRYLAALEGEKNVLATLEMIRTGDLVILADRSGVQSAIPASNVAGRALAAAAMGMNPQVDTHVAEETLLEHARQLMAVWN